jgi:O-antigen/teichoic acid export membrane protein
MSLGGKMSSDILVSTLMKLSLKIRGLVMIPLLTIFLSVADYGAYVQVIALMSLGTNICALGLDKGIVKEFPERSDAGEFYLSLLAISLLIAATAGTLIAVFSETISIYTLSTSAYAELYVVGAVYLVLEVGYRMGRSFFQAQRRIKLYSVSEVFDVYLSVGAMALLVIVFDAAITTVLWGVIIARGLVVLGIHAEIVRSAAPGRPTITGFRSCLDYSLPTMASDVARSLLAKIDRVLLGFFIGAAAVGTYSVAYSVAYLLFLYFRPLSISFFPEFTKLWGEDKYEQIRDFTQTGIRYFATLAVPSIAGFYLIGQDIISLLSTAAVADAAVIPLVLIALGLFSKGLNDIYTQLYFAAGESRIPMVIEMSVVILNVILNVLFIPEFGIVGAAITTFVSYSAGFCALYMLFQRKIRIPLGGGLLIRICAATVVMVVVSSILDPSIWVATVALSTIVYFIALIGFRGLRFSEIRAVATVIQ